MTDGKSIYRNLRPLIPLLVLTILCFRTLIDLTLRTTDTGWGLANFSYPEQYGAFVAVTFNWIAYLKFRPLYKFTLLGTIALGFINLINFNSLESTLGININHNEGYAFQATSFLVGLLTLILNWTQIKEMILSSPGDPSKPTSNDVQKDIAEIQHFINIYRTKSSDELLQIINDHRFTNGAIEAAKRVVHERDDTNLKTLDLNQ